MSVTLYRRDGSVIATGKSIREIVEANRASLGGADLWGANLGGASLGNANLENANLENANLWGANLWGANLWGADLRGANLGNAENVDLHRLHDHVSILPEGELIGWKKTISSKGEPILVKLRIPVDARRSNAAGRKCRCDKAIILSQEHVDGKRFRGMSHSQYDSEFAYTTGETLTITDFDEDVWEECAKGIHFFITRSEAEDYQ